MGYKTVSTPIKRCVFNDKLKILIIAVACVSRDLRL
jgi:hypothetical protein